MYKDKMAARAQHGAAPRNSVAALARREATGRQAFQPILQRRRLTLRQAFRQEEGGVLLGFSSDGNFFVYCITLDSCYEVQWRRVNFQAFYCWREGGKPPEAVFRLRVDGGSSPHGVSSPLEVWQSADQSLVVAITTVMLDEDRESLRLSRVAVAPSPVFDDGLAAAVTSLSFELSQRALSQKLEKWQLLNLSALKNVYHLIVNVGTAVHVLVFRAWRRELGEMDRADQMTSRHLGISHFPPSAWYYPPVFPIKFQNSTEHRSHHTSSERSFAVGVECVCQHLFDVERFLGEFLETFKPLQRWNLVDYDLKLVRASTTEKSIFMIYVMELTPSLTPSSTGFVRPGAQHLRVALFLSLEVFTGNYHIIRVLKVPGNGDLRQLSRVIAQRFHVDLNARVPTDQETKSWDNEAVLREESLQELHNPMFPLSISST